MVSVKCPSCATEMTAMTMEARLGEHVTIDVCAHCQAFWFDQFESLQLSPGATLKLMQFIGEHSAPAKPPLPGTLRCPRCPALLLLTHDLQRNMRFSYWRCDNEDGRFIGFFDFLKEKNFIHPLSPLQIEQLRQNIQIVNCTNCGAPVNLESDSVCTFCHSPISMLDMSQPQRLLTQLGEPAELPAQLETEASLAPVESGQQWWSDVRSSGLVQAGLNHVGRCFGKLAL